MENPERLHDRLAACVDAMTSARAAGDNSHYLDLDADFHWLIVRSANTPFIADAYQTMAQGCAATQTGPAP